MEKKLLNNLQNDIYCRIKPSKKHGVGLFAIRDIPENTNPFKVSSGECLKHKVINVHEDKINKLEKGVKKLVNDFYHNENGYYGIPYNGLNANDISYYMNHSNKPNIKLEDNTRCGMVIFKSKRKIKSGEELLIDYNSF